MSSLALKHLRRPVYQTLPTMYDLPSEDIGDEGMPDEYHPHQAALLSETFKPTTVPPDQVFTAMDLYIYYDSKHPLWQKRPDWFAVLGVPSLYEGRDLRMSYVVWQEGVAPLIIVELLSEKTQKEDLGQTLREEGGAPTKWEVYERILRVPYYVVFSRTADRMRVFKLNGGSYTEVIGHGDRLWIPEAGLWLGLWRGIYKGPERLWLRWYDAEGDLIPTNAERAEQECQRAEQERLRAEQECQRAEQERLRAEQERLRAEQECQRAEQERLRAEQERLRAEQERQYAEQERRRAEQAQSELDRARERSERLAEMLRQMGKDPDQI